MLVNKIISILLLLNYLKPTGNTLYLLLIDHNPKVTYFILHKLNTTKLI